MDALDENVWWRSLLVGEAAGAGYWNRCIVPWLDLKDSAMVTEDMKAKWFIPDGLRASNDVAVSKNIVNDFRASLVGRKFHDTVLICKNSHQVAFGM